MRKNPLPVSVALKESHLGEIMNHPDAKNLFFQIVTDQDGTENVEFLYNLVEFYLKKNPDPDCKRKVSSFMAQYRKCREAMKEELDVRYAEHIKASRLKKLQDQNPVEILRELIDSGLTVKEFLKTTGKKQSQIERAKWFAQTLELPILNEFQEYLKLNAAKQFAPIAQCARLAANYIASDEFVELDYFLLHGAFNLQNLDSVLRSMRFERTQKFNRRLKNLMIIKNANQIKIIKDGTYIFGGHQITELEKKQAIEFMEANNLPYSEILFKQVLRKEMR